MAVKNNIRIGLIGLGQRGTKTIERYAFVAHAQIVAIADVDSAKTMEAAQLLLRQGIAARTYCGEGQWKEMCQTDDLDLIYICTDWTNHAEMAIFAMQQGKHVATEVPAAINVEECWQLVKTKEATGKQFFMAENCCYDLFTLASLEMKQKGCFGDIRHCEGAYIHNFLGQQNWAEQNKTFKREWMKEAILAHAGNPYPTHGMGPIGWLMDLHRGDRMDYLVSLSSFDKQHLSPGARVNTTLIKTVKGKSILLQFDVTTHRPYSRLQTICGTKGFAQKYPQATLQLEENSTLTQEKAWHEITQHLHSHAAQLWMEGKKKGVPNEMNYAMDARLIYCLRHQLPLDIDVYDAAEWSSIAFLSQQSAQNGSAPVKIPDFTEGKWENIPKHSFKTIDLDKKER